MPDAAGPSADALALDLLEQAIDLPSSDREAWLAGADVAPDVRDRALALLRGGAGARIAFPTGGAARRAEGGPPPERIGAYRITGLIGQGGMGAVYRGERDAGDFDHVVAIKVIRPGALSEQLIERFRRERQTLARLAHPNIARLFDGGETAAGEPYIVMEYVEGRPLGAWIEAEKPPPDARIDLFLSVASAVAFAHQNLIVHGDVTPGNVLVDADGRARLIDFGISRPAVVDAPEASPSPAGGAHTATPGYAAPERVAGAPATTLSDVYSLGRVLRALTAGDGPDSEREAVIARATAADPAERYSTVEALRDDVVAWRRGFPVAAVAGGRGYVFRKFVGRHRLAVGGAATAAALLIAAFAVTLVANQREQAARAEAEARYQDVRSLAKVMMFDVYDAVSKVPGSIDARLLLARTAQDYLDSLAADATAPFDVRLEAGEGYFRLARVVGSTAGGSLGRRDDGKKLFEKSLAILEALHREAPERPDVRLALGHELSVMAGEALYNDSDSKTARTRATRARALLSGLPQPSERSAGALAGAYLYEGDSYGWDNDLPAAGRVYEAGIRMVEGLPPALRDSDAVRFSMGGLLRQAGEVYRYTGQPDRAITRMEQAVALNRASLVKAKGAPDAVRRLIISLWSLGDMQRSVERLDQALQTISEALEISRDMVAKAPNDAGAKESVAFAAIVQAQVLSARGEHRAAVAAADEALDLRHELVARSSANQGWRMGLAGALRDAAVVYRAAGREATACASLREAHGIMAAYERTGRLPEIDRENYLKPVEAALRSCG
ncbi:MAG: protein kinase [Phenylobacterium sp.]|uniref:serine/threonine-protein kinase n=1 Tax=Phenylobacterium sp. TaxID=1871053 RepID=UPI0025D5DEC1|nr:serine/threonine-protein kinase [Phenylobacterium sp.]MBI1199081.1 protein kinase [Phenylobacterium sp.]